MTTDYHALCAELSFIWGRSTNPDDLFENMIPLVDRARAALAQSELEGVTDEEIDEETATLIPWLLEKAMQAADSDQPCAAGRLTLAAQLLGERRPTIQPVPVSERPILRSSTFNNADGHCWCGTSDFIDESGDLPVSYPPA
jgi:hypothetical protein